MEYFKKRDLVIEKWSNPYRTLKFVQMNVGSSRSKLNFDNATGLGVLEWTGHKNLV